MVRAGYGVFFIPNYVSFALNPDNDVINLAATDFTASTNGYITPASNLDGALCGFTTRRPGSPPLRERRCSRRVDLTGLSALK